MPIDDLAGEVIGRAMGSVVGVAAEVAMGVVFSKHGARYFHGIGRRVIAVVTFGRKRIPSSLRIVPAGVKPKPRTSDWLALFVGIGVWLGAAAVAIAALLL